jgi:hypothetical protein
MSWEQIFNMPCGCKRNPGAATRGTVLVQTSLEEMCQEHRGPADEVARLNKQIQNEIAIAEEMRAMAIERINKRKTGME